GKVFWSLQSGSWGLETGTMPNKGIVIIAPGTERFDIAPGYYMGGGYVAGDADLLAENVAEGVNIFGVNGSHASEIHYEAGVPKTGQTSCFTTTNESQTVCPVEGYPGQDGDNLSGVEWPAPRFVESDGVVADNLTGLVWLQDANCLKTEEYEYDGLVTWPEALDFIAGITATGPYSNCAAGFSDWRMPSLLEMQSLIDYGYYDPAVPNAQGDGKWTEGDPFFNLQSHYYWTGSSYVHEPSRAWTVVTTDGNVNYEDKTGHTYYLWPVRGGQ
ncbi:MAG: DUF1566 domain-containing protein, partial [Anaerolineales bacterium]|nr:DUF1566 domain-containing protein [Anaerolineales bacterium]